MESLYRKYRPQTFADVVGQQHVVGTLQRAVQEGRAGQAYLFCGPRGTGKTTMARLLAKSLMCEQGPGQLPDGTCEQCQLIAAGDHPDVYELDAASRTGVDNVREEIINRVGYAPVRGRYKVYIIDEVHMLTTAAFNALLKTLEEPPSHVVFVLCTTDPQKIPATILSRVQRFDFRPIGSADIHARLVYVCQQEGFAYEDAALDLVVSHARGGMRDALSTLEQLSVFGGGTISADAAEDLLGAVPGAEMSHVIDALAARDVPMLFLQIGELIESGRDPLQFARDLAAHMRDVYVVAVVGARPEVLDAAADVERLQAEASAFGSADRIARVLTLMGDVVRQMATAPNQRLVLEIAFTRMARPQEDLTLDSLAERVADVERAIKALQAAPAASAVAQGPAAPVVTATSVSAPTESAASAPSELPSETRPAPVAPPVRVESPAPAASVPTPPAPPAPARPTPPAPARPAQPAPAPARPAQPAPAPARPATAPAMSESSRPAPPTPASSGSSAVSDAGELQRRWRAAVNELVSRLPSRGSLLSNAVALNDDGQKLEVGLPKGSLFALKMLERPDIRAAVEEVVAEQFGHRTLAYQEGLVNVSPSVSVAQPYAAPAPTAPMPPQVVVPAPPVSSAPQVAAMRSATPEPSYEPSYPMPWDAPSEPSAPVPASPLSESPASEPPAPEYVPYEEMGIPAYEQPVAEPAPPAPEPVSQSASQSAAARTAAPVAAAPVAPEHAAPVAAAPVAPEHAAPAPPPEIVDDLPPDLAAVLANAFEVFGPEVKVKR